MPRWHPVDIIYWRRFAFFSSHQGLAKGLACGNPPFICRVIVTVEQQHFQSSLSLAWLFGDNHAADKKNTKTLSLPPWHSPRLARPGPNSKRTQWYWETSLVVERANAGPRVRSPLSVTRPPRLIPRLVLSVKWKGEAPGCLTHIYKLHLVHSRRLHSLAHETRRSLLSLCVLAVIVFVQCCMSALPPPPSLPMTCVVIIMSLCPLC